MHHSWRDGWCPIWIQSFNMAHGIAPVARRAASVQSFTGRCCMSVPLGSGLFSGLALPGASQFMRERSNSAQTWTTATGEILGAIATDHPMWEWQCLCVPGRWKKSGQYKQWQISVAPDPTGLLSGRQDVSFGVSRKQLQVQQATGPSDVAAS